MQQHLGTGGGGVPYIYIYIYTCVCVCVCSPQPALNQPVANPTPTLKQPHPEPLHEGDHDHGGRGTKNVEHVSMYMLCCVALCVMLCGDALLCVLWCAPLRHLVVCCLCGVVVWHVVSCHAVLCDAMICMFICRMYVCVCVCVHV